MLVQITVIPVETVRSGRTELAIVASSVNEAEAVAVAVGFRVVVGEGVVPMLLPRSVLP